MKAATCGRDWRDFRVRQCRRAIEVGVGLDRRAVNAGNAAGRAPALTLTASLSGRDNAKEMASATSRRRWLREPLAGQSSGQVTARGEDGNRHPSIRLGTFFRLIRKLVYFPI
jgi:hypothetical protein